VVDRIGKVLGLDHIVLLVAPQAVLRAERGGNVEASANERVEAMREITSYRGGMGEQRNALAFQRPTKLRLREEPVDTEQGHGKAA
jgi:hypothetical protein